MRYISLTLVLLLVAPPLLAINRAEVLQATNAARQACARGNIAALKLDESLSRAAAQMQRGANLNSALEKGGYRADKSAVMRLRGKLNGKTLAQLLTENYCATLREKDFVEIGIYSSEREAYILIAKPFTPPKAQDASVVAQQVLQLVNEARAKPRRCGSERFAAASPLTMNDKLTRAALAHSKDMAKHGNASHDGSDGSSPGDRATRAGYLWRNVGENVAAGQLDAKEVMQGWLGSPHHCANVMAKEFTEMGLAYAVNPKSESGIYWTQLFGRAR